MLNARALPGTVVVTRNIESASVHPALVALSALASAPVVEPQHVAEE